jgi:hypothetical protein
MLHPRKQPRLLQFLLAHAGGQFILDRKKLTNERAALRKVVGELRAVGVFAHCGPHRLAHFV